MLFRIISFLIGYALGSIQTGFIIGKFNGIDIREHESGNAGATNVKRVLGKKFGIAVLVLDAVKAILAYVIASAIFGGEGTFIGGYGYLPGFYAGLGAIIGHCFPFYLKFKGGKGAACLLGVMFAVNFFMATTIFALSGGLAMITRYVSLSSMVMSLTFVIFLYLYNFGLEEILLSVLMFFLCVFMHRGNVVRLFNGTERKI